MQAIVLYFLNNMQRYAGEMENIWKLFKILIFYNNIALLYFWPNKCSLGEHKRLLSKSFEI